MITLHESNITSFPLDNGIGVLSDAIRAYAEEEINGMFEFYMEYDSEGHLVGELKEERIIKAKAQDKLGYQLFRIYSITKNHENDNIIVNAQHITYDLANNFVEKLEAIRMTKKQVMEKIGNSTVEPHPFNVTSSNTTTVSSTNLYRTNPLQMIAGMDGSILQIWGGQIERDNFNLILHDRRGHDDGVTVTYEKNITGLTAEFDISGVITRIFPFIFIEATDDEPERLITVDGKYIDSPHINDYEVIRTEPIDYSSDDRINTDNKTDAQIRQQLTNVAKNYFKETGNDKPKTEMEVQFAHLWETEEYKDVKVLELVGMGDTVTINHSKLKVDATAIVNYIKYDCIAQVNEEVKLGRVKARLTDNVNKIDTIERKVEQAESNANQAIISANGKNTTFYGPDEPTIGMQKGDLWFKVIDGQFHKTYRFDGIEWKEILDMDSQEAKAEAQQARERADDAVNRANQATQQASDAINQAQTAIGQAQASFDLAQENALELETLGLRFNDVEGNLTTISSTVQGLQTTVSDIDGNVSNLTQLSTVLQSTVSSLQDEWDNLEIGGRNLLLDSEEIQSNSARLRYSVSNSVYDLAGKKVTVSFMFKHTITEDAQNVEVYLYDRSKAEYGSEIVKIRQPESNGWEYYETTFIVDEDIADRLSNVEFTIRLRTPTGSSSNIESRNVKLEKGTIATDWSPAPEDIDHQFSVITQTIDSITTRVGDAEGNINTLTQTVDATVSRISSLANPNLITHDPSEWVEMFGFKAVEERIPVKKNTDYVLTDYSTELVDNIQVNYDNQLIDADVGGEFIFNTGDDDSIGFFIKSSDPDFYEKLGTVYRFKLEEGTESTAWTAHDEDIYTQYSQLSDAINLRVAKGDVINQINLDTSGVLIGGDKILLDGNVTVTGDFKLDGSAHIKDASIGTAQIGTIDAAIANIINLSANSIVGGILQSQNSNTYMDLNTGEWYKENSNITLGGGANINFTNTGNKLQYDLNGRKSGVAFTTAIGGEYPLVALGVTTRNSDLSITDEARFSGFIANGRARYDSDGILNSVVGLRFDIRDETVDFSKGFTFRLGGNTIRMYGMNSGRYDYHIGDENNSIARSYIRENYANGTEYQIRYTHQDRQGFAMMMSYQGESRLAFYGLNSHSGEHYGLGKSNRRFNWVYLNNNPDVSSDSRLKKVDLRQYFGHIKVKFFVFYFPFNKYVKGLTRSLCGYEFLTRRPA